VGYGSAWERTFYPQRGDFVRLRMPKEDEHQG